MNNDLKVGFVKNEVFKVKMYGNSYKLINTDGENEGTRGATIGVRKNAFKQGKALQAYIQNDGKKIYRKVSMDVYNSIVAPLNTEKGEKQVEKISDHQAVTEFIHKESIKLKPKELVMKELKWKYLIRSAVRAKNIMMVGPSGCGKTMAAKAMIKALDRPFFYFNLGATQDPRATLIGNTHFDSKKGTFFSESAFVTAIKTPKAQILLDELSRAHPDAGNILMTVLDNGQRYLRLDEKDGSPVVKVAEGVTFIATANIGNEYTSTRVMDRALLDRFVTIEMDVLNDVEEFGLLKDMYPKVDEYDLKAVAEIAHNTREQMLLEDGKTSSYVSTRASVEMGGLLYDGFSLQESAEIAILPFFSPDGGIDSERTYVKQLIQRYERDNGNGIYDDTADVDDDLGSDIPKF